MAGAHPTRPWLPARVLAALALGVVLSIARAAGPGDGTEAFLTDGKGDALVGYGAVHGGLLVLRLGTGLDRFILVLVDPYGSMERFEGVRGAGNTLMLDTPEGKRSLQALLRGRGIMLRTTHADDMGTGTGRVAGSAGGSAGSGSSAGNDGSDDSGETAGPGSDGGGEDGTSGGGEGGDAHEGGDSGGEDRPSAGEGDDGAGAGGRGPTAIRAPSSPVLRGRGRA